MTAFQVHGEAEYKKREEEDSRNANAERDRKQKMDAEMKLREEKRLEEERLRRQERVAAQLAEIMQTLFRGKLSLPKYVKNMHLGSSWQMSRQVSLSSTLK